MTVTHACARTDRGLQVVVGDVRVVRPLGVDGGRELQLRLGVVDDEPLARLVLVVGVNLRMRRRRTQRCNTSTTQQR